MYDCRHLEALLRRLDGLSRATSGVLPVTSVFETETADSELESGPVFMFASIPSSSPPAERVCIEANAEAMSRSVGC